MAIGVRDSTFSTDAVITGGRDFWGSRVAGAQRRPPGRFKKRYVLELRSRTLVWTADLGMVGLNYGFRVTIAPMCG
jgi:hypothetical protein